MMKKSIQILIFLIIFLNFVNVDFVNPELYSISNYRINQTTAEFDVSLEAPETVPYGQKFNITAIITLKESITNSSDISIKMELATGFTFDIGCNDTRILGDFATNETKIQNFTLKATTGYLNNPDITIRVLLYKENIQQYVDTEDGVQPYFASNIRIQFPELDFDGPLEYQNMVVAKLRLSENEINNLTFTIENTGQVPIINISLIFTFDDPVIEIISIENDSISILEVGETLTCVIQVKCTVDHKSETRIHVYLESDYFETIGRNVKVTTYDWWNVNEYDNELALIMWPVTILAILLILISMVRSIRKKKKKRMKIEKDLEEKYGKAKYDSDQRF